MRLALLSAAGQPEPTAWAHVELAKLELAMGRNRIARRHVIAALASASRLSERSRRARSRRGGGRQLSRRDPRGPSRGRCGTDPAGGCPTRRPPRAHGPDGRSAASARHRRSHRSAPRGQRRQGRSRVGLVPRGQPDPPGRDGRACATCPRRPAVDLRRRRPRLGADGRVGATRPCLSRSGRSVSGHRIRSSTSTVATPRAVPAIELPCASGTDGRSR